MARDYTSLFHRIWADPDWRALDVEAQQLYLLLISQSNMNLAGVMPVQTRRWSQCSADRTEDDVQKALSALEAARFVLVDRDTEELLARSFVRVSEAYKTPGMLRSILKFAVVVQAPSIRRELAIELGRLHPLNGKLAADGQAAINATRLLLMPEGTPPDGGVIHSSEGIGDAIDEPIADTSVGTHRRWVDESAKTPIADTPSTSTGTGTSLSLVRNMREGERTPPPNEAPGCTKHSHLDEWDTPPCRACQRLRETWEVQRDEWREYERTRPREMCAIHTGQVAGHCSPCRSEQIAADRETA